MVDRNRRIKLCPERFQASEEKFDVVITCEERVYDQLIECMETKGAQYNQPVHVINIDIQDNQEEAVLGAFQICDLVEMMAASEDLDNDIDEILHDFESKSSRGIFHSVMFYWKPLPIILKRPKLL